jgi:dolichol-phosphate mannosyltransferase
MSQSARRLARRFLRFGLVGASGTAVNLTLFWGFTTLSRMHFLAAGPLAFELSFVSNYALHNAWTFGDRRSPFLSSTLLKSQIVAGGGLLINLAALYVFVSVLGLPSMLGNLSGVGLATAWNFCLSSCWTWRSASPQATQSPIENRLISLSAFKPAISR